jgi:predicted ArsR family transcriptional regulator
MPKVLYVLRTVSEVSYVADIYRTRRRLLLRHLLRHKTGASVDELAQVLSVTRTAARQHLAASMRDGLVTRGQDRASGGRPHQLYVLTDAGKEEFPRHYAWFAHLLVEAIADEHGRSGLRTRLGRIAATVVEQLRARKPAGRSRSERVVQMSTMMDELGYDARTANDIGGAPTIEADNCVFHELARKNPVICEFDIALLSGYTQSKVELHECMAKGGHVCRFRFVPRR